MGGAAQTDPDRPTHTHTHTHIYNLYLCVMEFRYVTPMLDKQNRNRDNNNQSAKRSGDKEMRSGWGRKKKIDS